MDVSNDSLLHRLVTFPDDNGNANTSFRTALQRMGLKSVFDIVRMGKAPFAVELARHCDTDAGQTYDNAASYAQQIGRLYQQQQISSGDTRRRVGRGLKADSTPDSVSYQSLFKENWDQFCKDGDIAAIDSPVAYLRALYLFAGQLENASSSLHKITLAQRRPDLKALMLDHQSAFVAQPMLGIVNNTLRSAIEAHIANAGKTVHQVLSSEQYPFSLPYDLHHHQCLLGLGADKPALGELNYRISLALPFSPGDAAYGRVSQSRVEAQKLLSGLSPEQQKLLLAPVSSDGELRVLEKSYGTKDTRRLHELTFFKERTGLSTEQVEQLLAQGTYFPRTSTNSPPATRSNYGSGYINGPGGTPALAIVQPANTLGGTSRERFARMQRMIRLQRWTDMPVAELDTLLVNALRSEYNDDMTLNANTLRTLGVYRYLNRRHGIAPQEFASLLHDMPISACGQQVPLFDQVFNRTQLLERPRTEVLVMTDLNTFSYLGAGLGLGITQDSLLLLAKQTKKYHHSFKYDLPTVSSLYRQARVARMFGLSPAECTMLARVLGGSYFCETLVTGALNATPSTSSDILDVLMALDWAVDWLRQNNRDVTQWCRLFDTTEDDLPLDQNLEERLAIMLTEPIDPGDEQRLVETLLHDLVDLSAEYIPGVLQMAGTTAAEIVSAIQASPGKMPPPLASLLRTAQACHGLHLSSSALQRLISHPTWLAPSSRGTLTPHTLYLLERFSHCARHQVRSEEPLLHYLQFANQPGSAADTNRLLADLLNWDTTEVSDLTAQLVHQRAQSMEAVDWVIRCQACCQRTGLSAGLLLKACALNADSETADWRTVGEALIATCH
ncbi:MULTISPECIES: Tc toxin subunit A [Pseudomonas]|uniref:Tc toxin subunit A n=1 Tax=Pseudomonas TaxID=286 RepID=UPI001BEB620D|nr:MULTISPECIES: Tc toxin subunit A [Pseudomonas]MBT2341388.1 toxin [Pseudomonas fluorescens]MCD4528972.1 Tc toxin subunit A [Pseudomonas sp. C3-2018]